MIISSLLFKLKDLPIDITLLSSCLFSYFIYLCNAHLEIPLRLCFTSIMQVFRFSLLASCFLVKQALVAIIRFAHSKHRPGIISSVSELPHYRLGEENERFFWLCCLRKNLSAVTDLVLTHLYLDSFKKVGSIITELVFISNMTRKMWKQLLATAFSSMQEFYDAY